MLVTIYPKIALEKCMDGKIDWWKVTTRVRVRCDLHPYGRIHIPVGFISDFASVPRPLWGIIPPHGRTSSACVVHDYLYEAKPLKATRAEVDLFWKSLLKQSNIPRWQVNAMYYYVKLLGWYNWYNVNSKVMNFFLPVITFFKSKKWILPVITYTLTLTTGLWLGVFISKMELQKAEQLAVAAALREQSLIDSLNYHAQLAQHANTISQKDETILSLRQEIRSDSIAHLSELQAVRAINAHLKSKR